MMNLREELSKFLKTTSIKVNIINKIKIKNWVNVFFFQGVPKVFQVRNPFLKTLWALSIIGFFATALFQVWKKN